MEESEQWVGMHGWCGKTGSRKGIGEGEDATKVRMSNDLVVQDVVYGHT